MLTFCFLLFYFSGECDRFLHQGGARCALCDSADSLVLQASLQKNIRRCNVLM